MPYQQVAGSRYVVRHRIARPFGVSVSDGTDHWLVSGAVVLEPAWNGCPKLTRNESRRRKNKPG
jgi:hypothetical protein